MDLHNGQYYDGGLEHCNAVRSSSPLRMFETWIWSCLGEDRAWIQRQLQESPALMRNSNRKFYGFDFGRLWIRTAKLPGGLKGWHFVFHCPLFGFSAGCNFPSIYKDGVETSISFHLLPRWPLQEGEFFYRYNWERTSHFISFLDLDDLQSSLG